MRENQPSFEPPFEPMAGPQQLEGIAKETEKTPNPEQTIAHLRTEFDALVEKYNSDIGQLTGDLYKDHPLEMRVAPEYVPKIVELIQTAQRMLASLGTPVLARTLMELIHNFGLYGIYRHNTAVMAAFDKFYETVTNIGIDPKETEEPIETDNNEKPELKNNDCGTGWEIPGKSYMTIDGRPYASNFMMSRPQRDWNRGKSF